MNKTYELCPYCDNEVELRAELKVQKCPSCGKHIIACSMCERKNCNDCIYCRQASILNEKH